MFPLIAKTTADDIDHRYGPKEWGGNVAEEPTSGVSFRRSNKLELLTGRLGNVRLLRAVDIILNHFDHAERSDEEEFNKPDVPAGDPACLTEIV